MANAADITLLREKIGESITEGMSAGDTMVTDEQVAAWFDANPSIYHAAIAGWEFKLAHWAGLVNVVDGAAARNFSDLMDHALIMINRYTKLAAGPAQGRSRVGRIRRP